ISDSLIDFDFLKSALDEIDNELTTVNTVNIHENVEEEDEKRELIELRKAAQLHQLVTEKHSEEKKEWEMKEEDLREQIKQLVKAVETAAAQPDRYEQAATVVEVPKKLVVTKSTTEETSHTFRVLFTEISRLRGKTNKVLESATARFAGVDWTIQLHHTSHSNLKKKYLGMNLVAASSSIPEGWSCGVRIQFELHSEDSSLADKTGKGTSILSAQFNGWGWNQFISIDDLFLPANGYVKDDSIFLTVEVNTFAAQ
ncbi:hypothetical protein PFISCL1PPCAC_2682, partial [Pristionchus fissidentatus]